MEAQRLFILTGVFFFSSVCSGMRPPNLSLDTTVFVAFEGEDLTIDCHIFKQQNKSRDSIRCIDPHNNRIYTKELPATTDKPKVINSKLQLNNMTSSGEYYCEYQTARVYWFLRVRANGYKEPIVFNYTEFIAVAVVTSVLLVFSVIGSIYVFRGHWKEQITISGKTNREQRQNRGETQVRETEEDKRTAPSPSVYASLEARPRSIYDVLDHSQNTEQTTEHPDDNVSESVYENL
ncbi:NFAT activation molecule 1 isoform X2 [Paralichthys olivaceus]|uniref:NFAT activation molecule 1 isoform X2 n=1 Tax=Paralichthys olivaceus TaxID=8255 RepID=UPI00374FF0A1